MFFLYSLPLSHFGSLPMNIVFVSLFFLCLSLYQCFSVYPKRSPSEIRLMFPYYSFILCFHFFYYSKTKTKYCHLPIAPAINMFGNSHWFLYSLPLSHSDCLFFRLFFDLPANLSAFLSFLSIFLAVYQFFR